MNRPQFITREGFSPGLVGNQTTSGVQHHSHMNENWLVDSYGVNMNGDVPLWHPEGPSTVGVQVMGQPPVEDSEPQAGQGLFKGCIKGRIPTF